MLRLCIYRDSCVARLSETGITQEHVQLHNLLVVAKMARIWKKLFAGKSEIRFRKAEATYVITAVITNILRKGMNLKTVRFAMKPILPGNWNELNPD
jgi:hypothetical protein